jgi:hypothetical protein
MGTVLVVEHDDIVLNAAFGYAYLDWSIPEGHWIHHDPGWVGQAGKARLTP